LPNGNSDQEHHQHDEGHGVPNQEQPTNMNDEKEKKMEEKRKKYNNAPVYKNCGKKHPAKPEDERWELEKNKDSCPSN
jgi:hypothetical protein